MLSTDFADFSISFERPYNYKSGDLAALVSASVSMTLWSLSFGCH